MEPIQYRQALSDAEAGRGERAGALLPHFFRHFNQYSREYSRESPKPFFSRYLTFCFPRDCAGLLPQQTLDCLLALEDSFGRCEKASDRAMRRACREACEEARAVLPRLLDLKRRLRMLTGNSVIQYDPLIVDLEKYRRQRECKKKGRFAERSYQESGYFRVISVLSNQMALLVRLGEGDRKMKVLLEQDQLRQVRAEDILQIKLVRRLFYTAWDIEDVRGCYSPAALDFLQV